jgi:hypothetical protein
LLASQQFAEFQFSKLRDSSHLVDRDNRRLVRLVVPERRFPFFPRNEPAAEDWLAVVTFNALPALQIVDWSLHAIGELNVTEWLHGSGLGVVR